MKTKLLQAVLLGLTMKSWNKASASSSEIDGSITKLCSSSSTDADKNYSGCDIQLQTECLVTKSEDYPVLKGMNCMDVDNTMPWYTCQFDSEGNFVNDYTIKVKFTFKLCNKSDEHTVKMNLQKSNVKVNRFKTFLKESDIPRSLEPGQCKNVRKWRKVHLCTFDGAKNINAYHLSTWLTGLRDDEKRCSCYLSGRSSSALTESSQLVEIGNDLQLPDTHSNITLPAFLNGDGSIIALAYSISYLDLELPTVGIFSYAEDTGNFSKLGQDLINYSTFTPELISERWQDLLSVAINKKGDRVAIVRYERELNMISLKVFDYKTEEDFWEEHTIHTEVLLGISSRYFGKYLFMSDDGNRIIYYGYSIQIEQYKNVSKTWEQIAVVNDSMSLEQMVANSNADRVAILGREVKYSHIENNQRMPPPGYYTESFKTVRIYGMTIDNNWEQIGQDLDLYFIRNTQNIDNDSIEAINMSGEGNHLAVHSRSLQDDGSFHYFVHVLTLNNERKWELIGQESIENVHEPQLNFDGSIMVTKHSFKASESTLLDPLQVYQYNGSTKLWEPTGFPIESNQDDTRLKSIGVASEKDRFVVMRSFTLSIPDDVTDPWPYYANYSMHELKDFSSS